MLHNIVYGNSFTLKMKQTLQDCILYKKWEENKNPFQFLDTSIHVYVYIQVSYQSTQFKFPYFLLCVCPIIKLYHLERQLI